MNGKVGGQPGNTNASKGKPAAKALQMLMDNDGKEKDCVKGMQALYNLWRVQYEKALNGDNGSMEMIVNRLDGRPAQALTLLGDEDNPIHFVSQIQRVIVDPAKTGESEDTNNTDG